MGKDIMIGAIFIGMFVLVPIIYLLTQMQMRMAKLVHRRSEDELATRVAQLEHEVGNLHQALRFVRHETANHDSLAAGQSPSIRQ